MIDDVLKISDLKKKSKIPEINSRDFSDYFADHLVLDYTELEEKNLEVKKARLNGANSIDFKTKFLAYLKGEKRIKAVTVCFTDLEGRLHLLDYDKKFILGAEGNLTFDGSSIKGFTAQDQSDLRLTLDWSTFRWLPADIFGAGKVLVFSNVCDSEGSYYAGDFRGQLAKLVENLKDEKGIDVNVAPEVEGFLFKGEKAEQFFDELKGFELATMSGYFNCLPQDSLRQFIDKFAEVQRALAFENEKDHPEVAPAQFELNYKYSVILDAADQILLYKLIARQVAKSMGFTASFLPKPIQGMNGSGMHVNLSLAKNGKNLFYDKDGEFGLSDDAHKFLIGVLTYANDLCLILNPSVNSYRRLDPKFEAPNEIKVSSVDRGSMIRIPMGNERSARIEVRTVAPDVNPYLCMFSILSAGLIGLNASEKEMEKFKKNLFSGKVKKLPGEIYGALNHFRKSKFIVEILGEDNHKKYLKLKEATADRSPRALGNRVKSGEILYHHEVTNQLLWGDF